MENWFYEKFTAYYKNAKKLIKAKKRKLSISEEKYQILGKIQKYTGSRPD